MPSSMDTPQMVRDSQFAVSYFFFCDRPPFGICLLCVRPLPSDVHPLNPHHLTLDSVYSDATQGGAPVVWYSVNSGFTHYPHHLTLDSVTRPKEAPVQLILDSPTIPIT